MTASGVGAPELERIRALCGAAADEALAALGRLAGVTVSVEEAVTWPGRSELGPGALARLGDDVLAVGIRMEGLLAGDLVVALPEAAARRLAAMLGQPVLPDEGWSVLAESAVMESGNIVGSAFVSEVARRARAQLLPSVPCLARGAPRECMARLAAAHEGPAVTTGFSAGGTAALEGMILVMPEPGSVPGLLAALDFEPTPP